MTSPTVSFVVPCYKLAHLLPECIDSILCQTYGNFEVLIMDDCSPDNTAEIAGSFRDPRVKHIRNEPNLGHLSNYNKGIRLAQGKYVWLISADDYLRRPYVLQRYVSLLDTNPRVGYTFCPGVGVKNGQETGVLGGSVHGLRDQVVRGHALLKKLLVANTIVTPSVLVRKECYERLSFFPLDMPWAGDWYLWCLFALQFDAGYFAEAMVCYREHDLSMTSTLMQTKPEICVSEDVGMPWLIRRKAEEAGHRQLIKDCLQAAAAQYARCMASTRYRVSRSCMTLEQFEESLRRNVASEAGRDWVRARVYAGIGNEYYWQGELPSAKHYYLAGLRKDPLMVKVIAKWLLLSLGNRGDYLRKRLLSFRENRVVAASAQAGGRSG